MTRTVAHVVVLCCALLCAVLAITHMNRSLEHCLDQYKSRHDDECSLLYYCGISETDRDLFQVEYLEDACLKRTNDASDTVNLLLMLELVLAAPCSPKH